VEAFEKSGEIALVEKGSAALLDDDANSSGRRPPVDPEITPVADAEVVGAQLLDEVAVLGHGDDSLHGLGGGTDGLSHCAR
jgi:hypothetical protein